MSQPWMSAGQIAANPGVTRDSDFSWIAEAGAPAEKIGRSWKFRADDVDTWVRPGRAQSATEGAQA